ncbi:MAG: RraA family protein [Shinella sp.]|uniref:RraA family protein n=1 Tax=Shinella sp. TaxID=1870904 RepID=UPI004036BEFC
MNELDPNRTLLDPALLARLRVLPAANIGDVQDRLGLMDAGIGPVWPAARIVGSAVTVLTAAGDNKVIHAAMDAAHPGEVIVINGLGDMTRALIGELMGEKAYALGLAGFVIDGCVRDADALTEIPMPVFSRGVTPAGPYKNGPGYIGRPIAMGGVVVQVGDVIVADADGVAVIRRADVESIVQQAEAKFAQETAKRAMLRQGAKPALA